MNFYEKLRKEKHIKYKGKWIKYISYKGDNILEEKPRRLWEQKSYFSKGWNFYYTLTFMNNKTVNIDEIFEKDFEICKEGEAIPSNPKEYCHYKINQLKGYKCDFNTGMIEAYQDILKRLEK